MFAARSSRSSAIRVLFLALVLALLVSARAAEDHDDHDDHDDEEEVDFACTAPCGAADAAHPCGATEFVASDDYSTCNLTLANIMNVAAYATATHVVPCPSDVCADKCTAEGATSDGLFNCFNTSVTTDATAAAANHRALAMGCVGNHAMNMSSGMIMYMVGVDHGDCPAGSVHFHDDDHDDSAAARATFAAAALVVALFAAAA